MGSLEPEEVPWTHLKPRMRRRRLRASAVGSGKLLFEVQCVQCRKVEFD